MALKEQQQQKAALMAAVGDDARPMLERALALQRKAKKEQQKQKPAKRFGDAGRCDAERPAAGGGGKQQ